VLCKHMASLFTLEPRDVYRKDFLSDYLSARALISGDDAYASLPDLATRLYSGPIPTHLPHPTSHPPFAIILSIPFAMTTFEQAVGLWLFSEFAFIFGSFYLLFRTLWAISNPLPALIWTLSSVVWPVVYFELAFGQWMTLGLILLTVAWYFLRSGFDIKAGIFNGAAMAIKFLGWPVLILMLLRRKWGAIAYTITTFTALNLFSAWIVGFRRALKYYLVIGPVDARVYVASGL
jgi:hypothetical protein